MWPFNRKKKQGQSVPEEIQQYYNTERRERVGVAWLLAGGTLILTVLLAIVLFFGGRWVYRTVFDRDNRPDTAQQEQSEDQTQDNDQGSAPQNAPSAQGQSTTDPSRPDGSASTGTPPPTTTQPQQTPATGENALPRTGPSDNLY